MTPTRLRDTYDIMDVTLLSDRGQQNGHNLCRNIFTGLCFDQAGKAKQVGVVGFTQLGTFCIKGPRTTWNETLDET